MNLTRYHHSISGLVWRRQKGNRMHLSCCQCSEMTLTALDIFFHSKQTISSHLLVFYSVWKGNYNIQCLSHSNSWNYHCWSRVWSSSSIWNVPDFCPRTNISDHPLHDVLYSSDDHQCRNSQQAHSHAHAHTHTHTHTLLCGSRICAM